MYYFSLSVSYVYKTLVVWMLPACRLRLWIWNLGSKVRKKISCSSMIKHSGLGHFYSCSGFWKFMTWSLLPLNSLFRWDDVSFELLTEFRMLATQEKKLRTRRISRPLMTSNRPWPAGPTWRPKLLDEITPGVEPCGTLLPAANRDFSTVKQKQAFRWSFIRLEH